MSVHTAAVAEEIAEDEARVSAALRDLRECSPVAADTLAEDEPAFTLHPREDIYGEPMIEVRVYAREGLPDDSDRWQLVNPIESLIDRALRDRVPGRWAFVRLLRRSDIATLDDVADGV